MPHRRSHLKLQDNDWQNSRYIRGLFCQSRLLSRLFQAVRRDLAGSTVGDHFKPDLLAFLESPQVGALDGADMDENVLAAILRLNEAEALLAVEEFNCSY